MPPVQSIKVSVSCQKCESTFLAFPSESRKYCGRACYMSDHHGRLMAKFWGNIDKTDTCWLWRGQINSGGYGVIYSNRRAVLMHRLSWELHRGPIPDGLLICHDCPDGDNPLCVNPDHLFPGTVLDNNRDMLRKNRYARGEAHKHTTLTNEQVREIRERYAAGGVFQYDLAREFGVCQPTISAIVNRHLWTHV